MKTSLNMISALLLTGAALAPSTSQASKIRMECAQCSGGFFSPTCDSQDFTNELTIEDGTVTFAYRARKSGVDPQSDNYFSVPMNECKNKKMYHVDEIAGGKPVAQTCFYNADTMNMSESALSIDTSVLSGQDGWINWASFYRIRTGGDDGTGNVFNCRKSQSPEIDVDTPANIKKVYNCAYGDGVDYFTQLKNEHNLHADMAGEVAPSLADGIAKSCLNQQTKNSVHLGQVIWSAVLDAEAKVFPRQNQ